MRAFIFIIIASLSFSVYSQQTNPRPKVGLVLSGGGAKGLAHIGVLKVLEEAGIHFDYIGGTSMGSIIGGLYSIGYTSEELKDFAIRMNWDSLLTDKIDRLNLPYEEKEENARYFFSFPIKEKKIGLPSGAITGQNIFGLLNKMASPVYRETDFTKYPIPFLCVATDIEKSQAKVFKSGYLPEAMRASMAIPSLFTPETIDGSIYVDGGVLNNLPALEVKKMGADIIIGVDVGFRPIPRRALATIPGIISQSMYIFTKDETDRNREICNVLIKPDLENYNLMNFNAADSIIALGERSARAIMPQLKALADSLNSFYPTKTANPQLERISKINVKEIQINGLETIPEDFILSKLQITIPSEITLKELDEKVSLIYGTLFFNKITYQLEPLTGNEAKITFDVSERTTNYFKVGIHYDSNFKTALLLNTTFRNLPVPGSKLTLDLALGENIAFNGLLYFNSGLNTDPAKANIKRIFPDFGIRATSHKMEAFEYDKEKRIASFDFFDFTLDFFWQKNLSNNSVVGGGVSGDYANINNRIGLASFPVSDFLHLNFHTFFKFDSYNRNFYPNHGTQLITSLKLIKGISDETNGGKRFFQGNFRYSVALPVTNRITVTNSLFCGLTDRNIIPAHYNYYLGGIGGTYLRGLYPFVGLKYMQLTGSNAWAAGTDLRFEVWENNFISLKVNIGKTSVAPKNLLQLNDITYGGGISYGYQSVIGPMEVIFTSSNSISGITGFINIGYWF